MSFNKVKASQKIESIKITDQGIELYFAKKPSQLLQPSSLGITDLGEWTFTLKNGDLALLNEKAVLQLKKLSHEMSGFWGIKWQGVFYPLKKSAS